jgi:hypothetical protein
LGSKSHWVGVFEKSDSMSVLDIYYFQNFKELLGFMKELTKIQQSY